MLDELSTKNIFEFVASQTQKGIQQHIYVSHCTKTAPFFLLVVGRQQGSSKLKPVRGWAALLRCTSPGRSTDIPEDLPAAPYLPG